MNSVSVVIPVFAVSVYLREALESIHSSTPDQVQVVIVDDGNAEPLRVDAAGLERLDITVLRQEHRGAAAARNAGIQRADGDILMFLDADDRWLPDKMTRQIGLIGREPDHAHVGWMQEFLDPSTKWDSTMRPHERLLTGPNTSTLAVHVDVMNRVGAFREDLRMGEVIEWFLRAQRSETVISSSECVLAQRRIHEQNRSRATRTESSDYLRVLREHLRS